MASVCVFEHFSVSYSFPDRNVESFKKPTLCILLTFEFLLLNAVYKLEIDAIKI